MRRIVIFAPHYAEYATRLAIGLAKKANVLLLLDRRNRQNECDQHLLDEAKAYLQIVEFGSSGRKERIWSLIKIVFKIVLFRPDIVNIQEEEGSFAIWVTRIIARLYPVLLTVHDPVPHTGTDYNYVEKNLSKRAETRTLVKAFHVHGQYCHNQLVQQIGGNRPILDVPHGVILVPQADQLSSFKPGRILLFGRMEAYKGVGVLLDAADILRKRGVHFHLVLAGRGPELVHFASRLGQHSDIEVIERFLTPAEAIKEFQKSQIVVLPYLNATQSGVAAAAFANGRGVIVSNTGGLAEIVQEGVNGLIIDSGRAIALADALETILTDTDLAKKLCDGAKAFASTHLNWDMIADKMLEFDAVHISLQKGNSR